MTFYEEQAFMNLKFCSIWIFSFFVLSFLAFVVLIFSFMKAFWMRYSIYTPKMKTGPFVVKVRICHHFSSLLKLPLRFICCALYTSPAFSLAFVKCVVSQKLQKLGQAKFRLQTNHMCNAKTTGNLLVIIRPVTMWNLVTQKEIPNVFAPEKNTPNSKAAKSHLLRPQNLWT